MKNRCLQWRSRNKNINKEGNKVILTYGEVAYWPWDRFKGENEGRPIFMSVFLFVKLLIYP